AAQAGQRAERGGPLAGGEVAVGDLGRGERQDALDEGEVGLLGEVGAGGGEVVAGGEFAVADHVAQGVPDDGPGEGVGDAGQAAQDRVEGGAVEADLGVGEVQVVGHDEGGVGARAGR